MLKSVISKIKLNSIYKQKKIISQTHPLNFKSELLFLTRLPTPQDLPPAHIIVVDANLLKHPKLHRWLKTFEWVYPINAGESLKQLKSFEYHLHQILKISSRLQTKNITFVGVGGGSVGDFVGFLASTFKRGSPLIHIPSTWLSAIDSAHGGKTALNIGHFKNQIGTFYPAQKVILCRPLLLTQPTERTHDAMGELIKTGLLAGGSLWAQLSKEKTFTSKKLWGYLPELIAYKYQIVLQDPWEKSGLRALLNLGHTFGHAFELYYKIPHGQAVNLGLRMALEFSVHRKIMTSQTLNKLYATPLLTHYLSQASELGRYLRQPKKIIEILSQDKKLSQKGHLNFIFLKQAGRPIIAEVALADLEQFVSKLVSTT